MAISSPIGLMKCYKIQDVFLLISVPYFSMFWQVEDVLSVPDFQSIPGVPSVPCVPCFGNDHFLVLKLISR